MSESRALKQRRTFPSKAMLMFSIAAHIPFLISSNVCGKGRRFTRSFTKPHKKKSNGVESEDLGGQGSKHSSLAAAGSIQRRGSCWFKKALVSRA